MTQQLVGSLILPRLVHCNSLLHGAPICVVSKLQRLQNNVARIVTRSDRRADAGPLLRQLHWLHVNYRVNFKIALLTYKTRTTTTPSYLSTLLSAKRDTGHHLRSSASTQLLNIPSVRTDFAARAFRVAAPSIWNSLPLTVLSSPSLSVFKSRLKTFLFSQAFDWPDLTGSASVSYDYGAI